MRLPAISRVTFRRPRGPRPRGHPEVITTALLDAASIITTSSAEELGTAASISAEFLGTSTILDAAELVAAPRRRRPSPRALDPDER